MRDSTIYLPQARSQMFDVVVVTNEGGPRSMRSTANLIRWVANGMAERANAGAKYLGSTDRYVVLPSGFAGVR